MTRIKDLLTAAANAVDGSGGSLSLPDAVDQQAAILAPAMGCGEWNQVIDQRDVRRITFWVAISDAEIPLLPAVFGSRVLGVRDGNDLVISRTDCPREYRYTFDVGPSTAGWRLARTDADPYLAKSWQDLAASNSGIIYLGGYADGPTNCMNDPAFTPSTCRTLLRSHPKGDCWVQLDGQLCRNGFLAGPDDNGDPVACTVVLTSVWAPCTVFAGEDPLALQNASTPDLSGE